MARKNHEADFSHVDKFRTQTLVVAFIDLVGFTALDSNKELFRAVRYLESQIDLVCSPHYYWGEKDKSGKASSRNDLLLIPTGDGYGLAFDHKFDDLSVFEHLLEIYSLIKLHYPLRMGINKGENYIVLDLNKDVNLVGWGINFAQRALMPADANQIVCTTHFAQPIIDGHKQLKDQFQKMKPIELKKHIYEFYNFKRDDYGISID